MRIHVVSLPHTLLTRQYDWCAYTAKVRRFVTMLDMAGLESIVYGPDVRDPDIEKEALEYVQIVDEADRVEFFGQPEWPTDKVFDRWQTDDPVWTVTNTRAAQEIAVRWRDGDVLGVIGGLCQQQIVTELVNDYGINPLTCEWGIGYSGLVPGTHRVYESYAWMHHLAGMYHRDDIAYYDAVVPNCFDVRDFTPSTKEGDYLLYMGRPNPRKGLPIIAEIAKRATHPVLIAGQPGPPIPNTDYVGLVTGSQKAELLAGAAALLSPTTYLEPFGGVAVEAMMSGTPVIATDWGAFTETVEQDVTGFRCRTLQEFMDAVENVGELDRRYISAYAADRYGLHTGSHKYGTYFDKLSTLHHNGWYELR